MRFSTEEYIEKEKVLKILSAILTDTTPGSEAELDVLSCMRVIRKRKSPDLVPVVRCKGCKHYSASTKECSVHQQSLIRVALNDFCSYGEEETDEQKRITRPAEG